MKKLVNPLDFKFTFRKVSNFDVFSIVRKINSSKAYGQDMIPPSLVKDAISEICEPLTQLINLSLTTSIFPSIEKFARVKPLFKSGNHSIMSNYRPISILPVFSKILESVVHNQLSEYLEKHQLLTSSQFGFRRNRNTQQAVTLITDHIRLNFDKGCHTGAVFLDLSKAFDTVDHASIINKLSSYGIEDTERKWFESYLFGRKQSVEYGGVLSDHQTITTGVPQGSILGPILFVLLMNDLHFLLKID